MIKIPLSHEKIALIDNCDIHLLDYKWSYNKHPSCNGYAYRMVRIISGSRKNGGKQKMVYLHHCIMGYPLYKKEVDHIDGNPMNNCRSNLRIVTHRENCCNHRRRRNGETFSKYIGVRLSPLTKRYRLKKPWEARIQINRKSKHLGYFYSEENASLAYQEALKNVEI